MQTMRKFFKSLRDQYKAASWWTKNFVWFTPMAIIALLIGDDVARWALMGIMWALVIGQRVVLEINGTPINLEVTINTDEEGSQVVEMEATKGTSKH